MLRYAITGSYFKEYILGFKEMKTGYGSSSVVVSLQNRIHSKNASVVSLQVI